MNRRELLATMSLNAAAVAMSRQNFSAFAQASAPRPFLGIQFFTFVERNGASMGFEKYVAMMETVHKIGYDGIELAGFSEL